MNEHGPDYTDEEREANRAYYEAFQETAFKAESHGEYVLVTVLIGWDKEKRAPGGQLTPIYSALLCSKQQAVNFAEALQAAAR